MFKTVAGPVEGSGAEVYLRPETAQGMFVNFGNVLQTSRKRPPFGIAQVGKSFRNEITPGNFIFRTREFEQMEMEFLFHQQTRLNGIHIGAPRDLSGMSIWVFLETCFGYDHTMLTSYRTTQPEQAMLSFCSRGDGVNSKALHNEPTMTSRSIQHIPVTSSIF